MKFSPGISFNLAEPADRVAEYIAMSEREGFQTAFVTDSQLIWRDVYVCLALALQRTSKIRVGTGVTNPLTRDASVTAGVAATLDEYAPGRMMLGIGVGDSAVYTLHKKPVGLADLKQAVQVIRPLVEGKETKASGGAIWIPWAKGRHVPIYLGSTGPQSLELAGEIADGVIINVGANSVFINWALSHLKEGARRARRRLDELDIWIRATCAVDDATRARAALRGGAATKANGLARYAVADPAFRKQVPEDLLNDMKILAKNYNYYEHERRDASHARFVTDRIIDSLVIAGGPSYCASRVKEIIEETGQTQFSFATYGFPDIPGFITRFGKEVARKIA